MTWITATAHRSGTVAPSGDAAMVHTLTNGTTSAAIVDGIGHSPAVAAEAALLARVIARASARHRPLVGILTGADQIADLTAEGENVDAVAVIATAHADDDLVRIAWVGDCRAYAVEDGQLRQLTTDHNLATQLAMCGYPGEITRPAAAWVTTTIATAAVATVATVWTTGPLVILTSDGVHDQMPPTTVEALVLAHRDHPQRLADALVAAAVADQDGYRDDATAIVLSRETR